MIPRAIVKEARIIPTRRGGELMRLLADAYQASSDFALGTPITLYMDISVYLARFPQGGFETRHRTVQELEGAVMTGCSIAVHQNKEAKRSFKYINRARITCLNGKTFVYDRSSSDTLAPDEHVLAWLRASNVSPDLILSDWDERRVKTSNHPGFIYIALNESMPELVKIGMTSKQHPRERITALSCNGGAGLPTPFVLVFYAHFGNRYAAEELIHRALAEHGIEQSKEFFHADIAKAIQVATRLHELFGSPHLKPTYDWDAICRVRSAWLNNRHKTKKQDDRPRLREAQGQVIANHFISQALAMTDQQRAVRAEYCFYRYLRTGYYKNKKSTAASQIASYLFTRYLSGMAVTSIIHTHKTALAEIKTELVDYIMKLTDEDNIRQSSLRDHYLLIAKTLEQVLSV